MKILRTMQHMWNNLQGRYGQWPVRWDISQQLVEECKQASIVEGRLGTMIRMGNMVKY